MQSFHVIPISLLEDGINITQLNDSGARLVYVTPSHQFPLGMTMPVAKRYQLIEWAKRTDSYIVEDDYDSEYRYQQQPIPSLHSLTNCDRIIYMSTFSKALLPSVRMSYMVLPDQLMNVYKRHREVLEQTASSIHQRTMYYFMDEGYWYAHLRKMRNIYKGKMKVLVDTIRMNFNESVKIIGTAAGLYIVLEINIGKSEEWLIQEALKHGVKVYACSPYFISSAPKHPYIQLGFAGLNETEIVSGIKTLANVWMKYK